MLLEMAQEDAREELGEGRHAQALGKGRERAAVRRMRLEVLRFAPVALAHCQTLLGRASHLDRKVAERELQVGRECVGEVLGHVGALVHQVHLGEHAHRARALRVVLTRELDGGIGLEIRAGRAHHQDDRARRLDVARDHLADLLLDVLRLPLRGERRHREPRKVDQRQVGHVRRVEAQEDGFVGHALLGAGARGGLRLDGLPDALELRGLRVGACELDGLLNAPAAVDEGAKLGAHLRWLGVVHQLERKRCARHHLLAEG